MFIFMQVDIFGHDILLVPIHLKVHWCLAAIDCKSKNISYYDSLQEENNTCLTILRYTITWCSMSSVIKKVFRLDTMYSTSRYMYVLTVILLL